MKTRTSIPLVVRPTLIALIINKIAQVLGLPGIDYTRMERRRDVPTDRSYVEISSDEEKDKDDKEDDDAKDNMP